MFRKMIVTLLLITLLLMLTACGTSYVGQYGGLSDSGIFVSMELMDDGIVETNIFGFPITGNYSVKNGIITIKISQFGYSSSMQGKITKDSIEFADVMLKRGVTSVEVSEVANLVGDSKLEDTVETTPTPYVESSPEDFETNKTDNETRLDEADRLFALGHYDEAIAIYDELSNVFDVQEQRDYAIECRDIRDIYFEWSYNNNSSDIEYDGLVLKKYIGYGLDEVIIPYGVCGLGDWVFSDENPDIKSIVFPETLKIVPLECLSGCTGLTTVTIPPSIERLALNGTGIKEIIIPATVKEIPYGAFKDCIKLETVVFEGTPALVEPLFTYEDGVFENCSSLDNVIVPASFNHIPKDMFRNCVSLKSVVIEEGISSIGIESFRGCTNLETIVLPSSTTQVGRDAFRECTSLKEMNWPSNVTTIPADCFRECTALANIILPETLTTIESGAFADCSSLRQIEFPKLLKNVSANAFGSWVDENIQPFLTLTVYKGSYAHRYAEEQGLSYVYSGDVANRVPLGYRFKLGEYNGKPIEWIVIAHNGDNELAVSIHPVSQMEYHAAGGETTYDDSAIKKWVDEHFYPSAFSEDENAKISKIQLLPHSYYETMICEQPIETSILTYWNDDNGWWLKEDYYGDQAWVAFRGYSSDQFITRIYDVRPSILIQLEQENN